MQRSLTCRQETWPLAQPFVVSFGTFTSIETVLVEIRQGSARGRGEAAGVFFLGESAASVAAAVESVRGLVEHGLTRQALQQVLPPGGARNALDCALWELEANRAGRTVADLCGLPARPLATVATVSLATPHEMAVQALSLSDFATLKLKLGADDPLACIAAVRQARQDAILIADVNGAWTLEQLHAVAPSCVDLGISMIEQPCARGGDADLRQAEVPITLCADESCCTAIDLDWAEGRYSMVNIKLDKTGGLTAAIELVKAAEARGFGLMVGNMMGTTLAMAPASLIAARCRYVDLDGPFLLAEDRRPGMTMAGEIIPPLLPRFWG